MSTAHIRPLLLVLCAAFVGCSSEPDTFLTYAQRRAAAPGQTAGQLKRSDELALQYANGVEQLFRARSTGARYTREGSDATVLGLGAVTAAGSVFSIGASGLSSLGFAQTGIGSMQKFFKADARSTAYREGAERIHAAIKDFMAYNLNDVSTSELSPNGWTLANIVQANIDIVSKMLSGTLPTAEALAQASEKMTEKGARAQALGTTPINNIPAGALTPLTHQQRVDTYRQERKPPREGQQGTVLETPKPDVPKVEEISTHITEVVNNSKDKAKTEKDFEAILTKIGPFSGEQPKGASAATRLVSAYQLYPDKRRAIADAITPLLTTGAPASNGTN